MAIEIDLSDVRRDYEAHGMSRKDMDPDPFVQFGRWLQRARDLELLDATAMTLATADPGGMPAARRAGNWKPIPRQRCCFTGAI
jgi:pyridoxamine 5'-phosphate oxidase